MFGEKLFETKLLSPLSHKVCRPLSSPVLLRKERRLLSETLIGSFNIPSRFICGQILLELISEGLYQNSGKEKESYCLVFTSSTKRQIHFTL